MAMSKGDITKTIEAGKAVLGIEFGSTRIKAVLIGEDNAPIAQGSHDWENRLENGIWTYSVDDIWTGLQDSYTNMVNDVKEITIQTLRSITNKCKIKLDKHIFNYKKQLV